MLIPPPAALPVVTSLADCADYSKTLAPYLHYFIGSLSQLTFEVPTTEALKHFYLSTNPVISGLIFSVSTFPIFLLVSEVNRNYSQVDRVWSILPAVFNAHYAIWARLNGLPTKRLDNVLAFSVLWSLRLSFNYWRKGGYQVGSEDYRWEIVKKYIGQPWFFLLNLLFISTSQILILFAVTTPTYILLLTSRVHPEMTYTDAAFSRTLIALIVIEYFADGQQWNYQQAKKHYKATAKVPGDWTHGQMERGFVSTGLWGWSRHPNFAAEQAIWGVLYAWAAVESGLYVNWTAVGFLSYWSVFQGSTPLTEWITSQKYPEYKYYQQRVGRFIPKIFGEKWDEGEMETLGRKLLERDERRKQK